MIEVKDATISYQEKAEMHVVLEKTNLLVEQGELFVILGASGSGKSTLLNAIGGFHPLTEGCIMIKGKKVEKPNRDCIMVFQSFDQLFPWFTLQKNLIFALRKTGNKESTQELIKFVDSCLAQVGLSGFERYYPGELSGGMKQRGALARALALRPSVLLLDEPFSSLDQHIRKESGLLLQNLVKDNQCTAILVTHDIEEALMLGSRIAMISKRHRGIKSVIAPKDFEPDVLREQLSIMITDPA